MEKVTVNKDLCIKCGMCVSMCSENFSFDKDGKSDVINETVTENTKIPQNVAQQVLLK